MAEEITTVGALRRAFHGTLDETPLIFQAVGGDGTAWVMHATIGEAIGSQPPKMVLALRHPELTTLPKAD